MSEAKRLLLGLHFPSFSARKLSLLCAAVKTYQEPSMWLHSSLSRGGWGDWLSGRRLRSEWSGRGMSRRNAVRQLAL